MKGWIRVTVTNGKPALYLDCPATGSNIVTIYLDDTGLSGDITAWHPALLHGNSSALMSNWECAHLLKELLAPIGGKPALEQAA